MEQDPDVAYFVPTKYNNFIEYINRFYSEGDATVIAQMESDLAEISDEIWPMNPIVVIAISTDNHAFGYYTPIDINDYYDQVLINVNWLYDNMEWKSWNYWSGVVWYFFPYGDEEEQEYLEGAEYPSGYYPTHADYINHVNTLTSKRPTESVIEETGAIINLNTEEAKDAYYFNASHDDNNMIIYYSRSIDESGY